MSMKSRLLAMLWAPLAFIGECIVVAFAFVKILFAETAIDDYRHRRERGSWSIGPLDAKHRPAPPPHAYLDQMTRAGLGRRSLAAAG